MIWRSALKNLWLMGAQEQSPGAGLGSAIAATAIVLGATVITNNVRDFELIDRHFHAARAAEPDDRSQFYATA